MFSLTNTSRHSVPGVPFSKVAKKVMGASYDLSVVFVTPAKMRSLNKVYRKKDTSTDILSFSVNKTTGELFFSLPDVAKKAPAFGLSRKKYFEYLFVHGLAHLKGFDHGTKMEKLEKKYCKMFGFSTPG